MVVWHSPLDLKFWFVNVLAGNMTMFLAIAFLVIAMASAMFRFPTVIIGFMFSLFIVMLAAYTGNMVILVLVIIGLIAGWTVARFFK